MAASIIDVENLTVSYGNRPALLDINFSIGPQQLIGIIGPNGSGKSTLLKTLLGFIKPDFGKIKIYGEPLARNEGRIAYVPQRSAVDWDFPITVQEVAMMGRYQYIPWWKEASARDYEIVEQAMKTVRVLDLSKHQIGELSGGQQQRVFMARALAQQSSILLLDEPFAGVDAATERAILDVLKSAKESGKTLIVVHHDLTTAAEYFDQLILIKQRLYAFGSPKIVLQEELLHQVYEGKLRIFSDIVISKKG
ncbi:MAG: metal ABC transporter ATP-binding protein [Oligoflexia bacterium]|nr:metal ABC transporter ATP-binding protein [Oligoflexia bacterium]MBF0364076.1 metal ABC transporter ATP-binding protein [Oligoflexia bacterium]